MNSALILIVKAVNGGLFVVAFALVAEGLKPKRFAGLFSAAPSVAIANLLVTVLDKGPRDGKLNSIGMIAGACAMVIACAAGIAAVRRLGAVRGSSAVAAIWLVVALASYVAVVR
ncbi:MAG: DUF3147 family protein [Actinobacteria bacterium]|nr:DUF3147 family protein [Actinomycetota bacterium]